MTKKRPLNEKALRKKIQQKLENDFQRRAESTVLPDNPILPDAEKPKESQASSENELYLRQQIESEVCSQYAEFILCENHLDEVRWLTPLELENEFEFYPAERSWFTRFIQKFKRAEVPVSKLDSPLASKLRADIEKDVKERLQIYRQKKEEFEKQSRSDLEKKIYQQEMDRFYKGKRGYQKYQNHLGETRWLTSAEFNAQEEFFDEALSPLPLYFKRFWPFAALILITAFVWIVASHDRSVQVKKAWLVVQLDENHGQLYIDENLAPGFKANEPYLISAGDHQVTMLSAGLISLPKKHLISPQEGDTTTIAFRFQKHNGGNSGVIRIESGQNDARVFIDGEFWGIVGGREFITLPEGNHSVSVEKHNFLASPAQHVFSLEGNDTLSFSFRMSPLPAANPKWQNGNGLVQGLIEVRSNIKNADIYLDGKKTAFQTDYVLQKIHAGRHSISLRKHGYTIYPDERIVKIDSKQKRRRADFTLSSTTRPVTIKTRPVPGTIFINGREVGQGSFKTSLALGEHQISFGKIEHYSAPVEQNIIISADGPDVFSFDYLLNYFVGFSPGRILPHSTAAYVSEGYLLNDMRFKNSNTNGPEIKDLEKISEPVWRLGYAFQYRNPPGRDALVFNFEIPQKVDLSLPLKLKLWIYRSGDNYPLIRAGKSYYSIDINGINFRKQTLPKHDAKQIGETVFDQYLINDQLRRGGNWLMISTTENSGAYVLLWKVTIE